jgi:hypothetical protein
VAAAIPGFSPSLVSAMTISYRNGISGPPGAVAAGRGYGTIEGDAGLAWPDYYDWRGEPARCGRGTAALGVSESRRGHLPNQLIVPQVSPVNNPLADT